jgi:hypothetical protein
MENSKLCKTINTYIINNRFLRERGMVFLKLMYISILRRPQNFEKKHPSLFDVIGQNDWETLNDLVNTRKNSKIQKFKSMYVVVEHFFSLQSFFFNALICFLNFVS